MVDSKLFMLFGVLRYFHLCRSCTHPNNNQALHTFLHIGCYGHGSRIVQMSQHFTLVDLSIDTTEEFGGQSRPKKTLTFEQHDLLNPK